MKEILTAVFDDDYGIIFGMEADKTLFAIECEKVEEELEPISAHKHSLLVLLKGNKPKTYAELVFSGKIKEHLNTESELYNEFIASMSKTIMEDDPNMSEIEAESLSREYWRD